MKNNVKACIVGWHEKKNAGDDAMLYVISSELRRRYEIVDITLLTNNSNTPNIAIPGVSIRAAYFGGKNLLGRGMRPLQRFFSAVTCDLLVFGGGSIFHSSYSVKWKLKMARWARVFSRNKKIVLLGVSLGPFDGEAAIESMSQLLAFSNTVLVRDQRSLLLASSTFSQYKDKFILIPDLTFQIPNLLSHNGSRTVAQESANKVLGVSLRPHPLGDEIDSAIIKSLHLGIIGLKKLALVNKVRLIEFCGDPEVGDHKLLSKLMTLLSDSVACELVAYSGNPIDLYRLFNSFDVFIGMRFHSQVFAILNDVPLVAIPYHQKTMDMISGLTGKGITFIGVEDLTPSRIISGVESVSLSSGETFSNISFMSSSLSSVLQKELLM